MENGRGTTQRLVNQALGTAKLDVHINRLLPGGPRGNIHRHSPPPTTSTSCAPAKALSSPTAPAYTIRRDQVIYIPAGMSHSLSNLSS